MMYEETPCAFCAQIAGSREHNVLSPLLNGEWSSRPVLLETDEAVVMPSIGALTTGHALVSPKRHVRSTALCEYGEMASLTALLAQTTDLIGELVGPVHVFEHGSSASCGGHVACSVEHAHVHVVPAPVDIRDTLSSLADWEPYTGTRDQLLAATGGAEYLFYESPGGDCLLATTRVGFTSQLLRRVLAECMGRGEDWNWRVVPAIDRVRATADLFAHVGHPATVSTC